MIEIGGAVARPLSLPVAALADLPRLELTADFHCVTGWSVAGLRWEGVAFETLYRAIIEPALQPGAPITHVVFRGLDGYRSVVRIEDALAPGVLLAERLGGRRLDGDHGAPVRLVSPRQYGYISTKHLCRIELHTAEPGRPRLPPLRQVPLRLLAAHPRARVWEEERHRHLPAWSLRHAYRLLALPLLWLNERGGERDDDA